MLQASPATYKPRGTGTILRSQGLRLLHQAPAVALLVHAFVSRTEGQPGDTLACVQAALPCLLAVPGGERSELTLRGGTDAAFAPPVWFTQHVTLPLLRSWFGFLEADVQVHCRCYLRQP